MFAGTTAAWFVDINFRACPREGGDPRECTENAAPVRIKRIRVSRQASRPRACGLGLRLEVVDLLGLHHCEPDVVEAVDQAMLAMGIDLEFDHAAVRAPDLLLLEVDGER